MATTPHNSTLDPSNEMITTSNQPPSSMAKEETTSGPIDTNATQISTNTSLSLLFKVLRTFMRPLRPRLVQLGDHWPPGSPHVTKRPHSCYNVQITERKVAVAIRPGTTQSQATDMSSIGDSLYLYDFEPPRTKLDTELNGAKREHRHTIYYFAGGGFQAPASSEHWKLCARLAKDLAADGVRVVLVSYALGPNSPAKDSLPQLRSWLMDTLHEASENARADEHVTLMGDSAGGNIVLSLAFWWSEQLRAVRAPDSREQLDLTQRLDLLLRLKGVFTISPPTDFRNVNPGIAEADKHDPVLTTGVTESAADAWCKDWTYAGGEAKADPTLSPALAGAEAWRGLRESNLRIDGVFGTADCLAPDARVFMDRCKKEGIRGKWLVWEGQMHCFPLTVCYGLKEGREGFEWIKKRVREVL